MESFSIFRVFAPGFARVRDKNQREDGTTIVQSGRVQYGKGTERQRHSRAVVRWLLLCFPVGLLMMWSGNCHWSRLRKTSISAFVVAVLVTVGWFGTHLPEQHGASGIVFVSRDGGAADVMGPNIAPGATKQKADPLLYAPTQTTVSTPAPTPAPYYVYANDGGAYYHMKTCRPYVKTNTPKVTILQAYSHGYKRCKECKPPLISELYGDMVLD